MKFDTLTRTGHLIAPPEAENYSLTSPYHKFEIQMLSRYRRVWSMTNSVYDRGALNFARRLALLWRFNKYEDQLTGVFSVEPSSVLARLFRDRPEMIGILVWPYQCASWDVRARLVRLKEHCHLVEEIGSPFDLRPRDRIVLADLSFVREGLRVVVDQPTWFMREGSLVVNLFLGRTRLYSLAFSMHREGAAPTATIGAIQGRDLDNAAEEYKALTKQAHGMRPRDLLFEIFCMLCSYLSMEKVYAVANEDRHHLHPYFGGRISKASSNYNEIWSERGGIRVSHSLFVLEVVQRRRREDEIPAKKRSMYRKRYEMLDAIREAVFETLDRARIAPAFASEEEFDL